jgi:molecular chaperone DnaK
MSGSTTGYRLGVDLGTTFTAAAVTSDRGVDVLALGNRALQVPSVVYLMPDGAVLVGEAAERRGTGDPTRLVREFKRRVGDSVPIIVGGSPYSPQLLLSHLLRWVVGVATERQGAAPAGITVSHPANWGAFKRDLLTQAIELADVPEALLCTEPEAAAIAYASRNRVATGERVAVYDLGGGTFDAAVLQRDSDGAFGLVGSPEGIEHLGGVDFDEAVFRHVLGAIGGGADALTTTNLPAVTALARVRRDCVEAKEALSADTETTIPVNLPGVATTVRLTRGEFEDMVRPAIGETVSAMRRVLRSANTEPADLAAIVLVGGSSRIPLVSELLSAEFGRPLALDTHPKHDVAIGAALRGTDAAGSATAAPAPRQVAAPIAAAAAPVAAPPRPTPAPAPLPPAATPRAPEPPDPFPVPAAGSGSRSFADAATQVTPPPAAAPPGSTAPTVPTGPPEDLFPRTVPRRAEPPAKVTMRERLSDAGTPAEGGGSGPSSRRDGFRAGALAGTGVLGALGGLAAVVAGLVALAVYLTADDDEKGGGAGPTTAPSGTPSATPSLSQAAQDLPRSAEPLGDDWIVWARQREDNWDLEAFNVADGTSRRLTTSPDDDIFAVISTDRRTVIYEHEVSKTQHDLRVVGADGKGDRPLFDQMPEDCENVTRPAWSRDLEYLAVPCVDPDTKLRSLKLVKIDGTIVRELDDAALSDPTFARDGKSVIYWRDEAGGPSGGALVRAPVDGSEPEEITPGLPGKDNDPAASPVEDLVAFRRVGGDEPGILVAQLDGGSPERLTEVEADHDPAWSPDGKRMVFIRDDNLWIMSADGSDAERLTNDGIPMTAPVWSTH